MRFALVVVVAFAGTLVGCVRVGAGAGIGHVSNKWVPGTTFTGEVHVEEAPVRLDEPVRWGGYLAGSVDKSSGGGLGDGETPAWFELGPELRYVLGRGAVRPYLDAAIGLGQWRRDFWVGAGASVHAGAGIEARYRWVGVRLGAQGDATELTGDINLVGLLGGSVHLLLVIGPDTRDHK